MMIFMNSLWLILKSKIIFFHSENKNEKIRNLQMNSKLFFYNSSLASDKIKVIFFALRKRKIKKSIKNQSILLY